MANSSWITLFDRQSRRFDGRNISFCILQVTDNQMHLKIASARFDASYGRTQVLFFT